MDKEKHNCDNVSCNHNNTKGLCCLFNPDNCKYRQLEKENAELKEELKDANKKVVHLACNQNKDLKRKINKAKEIIKNLLILKNDHYGNTKMEWDCYCGRAGVVW